MEREHLSHVIQGKETGRQTGALGQAAPAIPPPAEQRVGLGALGPGVIGMRLVGLHTKWQVCCGLASCFSCFCKSEHIETLRSPCPASSRPPPARNRGRVAASGVSRGCGGGGEVASIPSTQAVAGRVYYAKLLSQIAIKHIKLFTTYKSLHPMLSNDEKLAGRCTI